ncbi:MAG: N-acetyltransferase [Paenibacillus sp.]|uniref:N-acetyltransferase n=1 Tax=Paenibacillus sp. TaxID=58172 RepID=UPI0025EF1101|nr:N-acetyltransferase [Paenibacillus sp.]MBR2563528.1 N-acetyltransferase [Paenibacillus sp.]
MSVICRKAVPEDVEPLFEMIKGYAERGIILPRSREVLHRQLEHFIVAEVEGTVVGCGSLCRLGNDLVEVRSLGISEGYKGLGIGSRLLERLVEEAKRQQIPKVMALTYEVSFFLKNGFAVVEKEIFPEKVWTDCVHCSKQDCCDEIAVLKELDVSA